MRIKILLLSSAVLLTGFTQRTTNADADEILHTEQWAKDVIAAFQHYSSTEYEALFPTLDEFHKMIEKYSCLYGNFLNDAKEEFAKSYSRDLKPALRKSFESAIWDGIERGIEWHTVTFERVEPGKSNLQPFDLAPLSIVFSSNGVEYKLYFDKALVLDGRVKVSQFVKLIEAW